MPHVTSRLLTRILALALVLGLGLPALASAGYAGTPGAALSGRVTGPDDDPAVGVVVTLHDEDGAPVATATTDAAGEYAVTELPADDYDLLAMPPAGDPDLLAPVWGRIVVGHGDEVRDLELEVSNVRGVVQRSDGTPAAGAVVEAQAYGDHRAIAYPDGSFRFALPHGEWEVGATPTSENPDLDLPTSEVVVVEGELVEVELTLGAPNVRGTVVTPDETSAVAGARVRLVRLDGTAVPGADMRTRSDGSYGFAVRANEYQLRVEPPQVNPEGWVGAERRVYVTGEHTPEDPVELDVYLGGPTVTGVVRAPNGDPVPRAVIGYLLWTGQEMVARSDASGRYGLPLDVGTHTITLRPAAPTTAYLPRQLDVEVEETPMTLDLEFQAPTVAGRVVTADGLPVRNAAIRAYGPGADTSSGTGRVRARTDRQGRFALDLLPETTQRLLASPEHPTLEGQRTSRVVEVPATGTRQVEIALDRAPVASFDLVPLRVKANGSEVDTSYDPAVSHDGSVVAVRADTFESEEDGGGDGLPSAAASTPAGGYDGVVLHDRATGADDLLLAPNGVVIWPNAPIALDDDGSTVAFASDQNDLVAGDTGGTDVFVLDRASGTLTRLARPDNVYYRGGTLQLSGSGTRLLVGVARPGENTGMVRDVVVVDLSATGAETSRRLLGVGSDYDVLPGMSRDGSTVAWSQRHVGGGRDRWLLHVLDLATGVEDPARPFSTQAAGGLGEPETAPSLSDDGSVVAYDDVAHFAPPGSYVIYPHRVRVADRVAGTDRALDPFGLADEPYFGGVNDFELSGDGAEVLVQSRGGDPDETGQQAWVVDVAVDRAELISRGPGGASASAGISTIAAPSDFESLALSTSSRELTGTDEELVVLAVAESVAPEWPDGSSVSAATGDVGATTVRLQWTEATDNTAVAGYRVYRDGTLVGTTPAATRQLRLTGLTADTSYRFTVQAVDTRATESTDGPSVTVRTLPETSTELRPLDLTTSAGGVVDLEWEAARAADALLVRTYLGETQVGERALAGTATSAQERGLAAGTAYSFQVFTETGGTVSPYSERASITTPALTFGALAWTVPTIGTGPARRGSTAEITATAETGRSVQAFVEHLSWYDEEHELLDEPRTVTSVVPLTEVAGTPGTYRGGFELVDGVARLVRVTGAVSDGHGGTLGRAAAREAVRVSNSVVVTIDAPDGALTGGRLEIGSAAARQSHSEAADGGEVLTLDHLKPAADYRFVVVDDRGRTAAQRSDVRVRDGLVTALTLDPRLPARLTVAVAGPAGVDLRGTRVEISDADTGFFIESAALAGDSVEFPDVLEDQRIRVRVVHPADRELVQDEPTVVSLVPGDNRIDLTAQRVPRAELTGVVRYDGASPVEGVQVELRQQHLGHTVVRRATTGADGSYRIDALRRGGELIARSGQQSDVATVDLTGGPAVADLSLSGPRPYRISFRLFVRPNGAPAETGPVPLDWRTAVHYQMWTALDGQRVSDPVAPRSAAESGFAVVRGAPGQLVRWCIEGSQAEVQATCVDTTLGADLTPVVEMHAGPRREVTATVVDQLGRPAYDVSIDLYQVTDEGRVLVERTVPSSSTVKLRVDDPGSYLVEASKGELTASKAFAVEPDDRRLSVGTLRLQARTHFGGDANRVTSTRTAVLPGGDVELRAAWHNRGGSVDAVTARITVPHDTRYVADSLLVDGRPVVPRTVGGFLEVPLGAVPVDGSGALRYRLRPLASASAVAGQVELRYVVGSGTTTEPLAPVTVPVTAVSIDGPETVPSDSIALSGRAPAGAEVTLTDGGVPVGSTVAGPGGFWATTVTLATQVHTEEDHRLVAEVTTDGVRHFAEHVTRLDPDRPVVERISISQRDSEFANGRRFTFDPREGVARFPFVFVPGQTLDVEVTVDHPERVSRLEVVIGELRIPATRRSDGVFVASTNATSVAGSIGIDMDTVPAPMDLSQPAQSEQAVRDGVPGILQGFEVTGVEQPDLGSATRRGSFTTSVPGVPGLSVRSTLTVTRGTYTPTQEDLDQARESGFPAYGLDMSVSGTRATIRFAVPVSELPGADPVAGAVPWKQNARSGIALGVKLFSLEAAFLGATSLDGLLSALGSGDKYKALGDMVDLAALSCTPAAAARYREQAEKIALAAAIGDAVGAALQVGGLFLAPATFGLGTVGLGLIGWGLDKLVGHEIEWATKRLGWDIEFDPDCKDPKKRKPKNPKPSATPVWIYDPSGYVYEGARPVRIQGVTATLLTAPSENGPWTTWDAAWFGQTNPQTTDNEGRYGWDVPEGWWKVAYTKDGYQPAYSRALRVLPPHLDVDVSMTKLGFPHVTASTVRDGGVDVTFDRLVRSGTTDRGLTVVGADGGEVPGTWSALGATTGDGDVALQRGLRFTPTPAVSPGTVLTVTVDGVADYSGRLMAGAYTASLTVPRPGGGTGGGPVAKAPAAPTGVAATAGERFADVAWSAPDDGGAALIDYVVTVLPSGRQVTVDADETSVRVEDLVAGSAYRFTVTARNAVGTGPASAPSGEVVPTADAPRTTLTAAPSGFVASRTAEVAWEATGATYVCVLDGADRPCAGTGLELAGLRSGTHVLTVAAVDEDGDADPTPEVVRWTVPRDDRALSGGGAWQRKRSAGAFQGTYSQARDRGATLTATVTDATRLALVVARGRGMGTVTVYVGKDRVGRVDLASSTSRQRQLVALPAFDRPRSGTVRIVVTSRRDVVRVDGLAVATG